MSNPTSASRVAETIAALLSQRADGLTICPSEVARALESPEMPWRSLMDEVRATAGRLVAEGRLRVTQRGVDVDPAAARGPIRLGRPR